MADIETPVTINVVQDRGHGVATTKAVTVRSSAAGLAAARKRRPARKQAESRAAAEAAPPQTGTTFNIWYGKWAGGDREDSMVAKNHAETRCIIARDSGYTRADKSPAAYFCLFFARGMCPNGPTCQYLHRLPTVHDMFNPNVDCFGRDKHADYRDDMGGVGSFMRQNHTLYIGRIHVSDDIEEVVARHCSEWGQVERIRVLNSRGIAFVTYVNEANAQFAKEALAHQSFDHTEILNVRWATRDPNPMAASRDKQRVEEQAAEAIRRALPPDFIAELEGRDVNTIKKRKTESSLGLRGYEAPDEIWYARGTNAVNPAGRVSKIDSELDASDQFAKENNDQTEISAPNNGIISSAAFDALKSLSGAPSRVSLVADYGSEDEETD